MSYVREDWEDAAYRLRKLRVAANRGFALIALGVLGGIACGPLISWLHWYATMAPLLSIAAILTGVVMLFDVYEDGSMSTVQLREASTRRKYDAELLREFGDPR